MATTTTHDTRIDDPSEGLLLASCSCGWAASQSYGTLIPEVLIISEDFAVELLLERVAAHRGSC